MSIFRVGRLFTNVLHVVFLFIFMCLLPAVTAAETEKISQLPPAEAVASDQSESVVEEAADTDFVFEEPTLQGNDKTTPAILPEPDTCFDLPSAQEDLPRIAIIIDDMGHHKKIGGELLDLDMNLTFSFLPRAPFTEQHGERAWKMGRDVLVHMPMEPRDPIWDPGPGALFLEEPVENIVHTVEENLALVPHAIGVNNHMGSRFTADRQAMHEVLSVLQKKSLFFVDSLTAPESVGADVAREMGVRTARRHVFLDNSQDQEDICRQLKRLVAHAKKYGVGIGIGHPNRATINALKLCREMLLGQVRIVGIHELVE